MPNSEYHKLYTDEFEEAFLESVGAIVGWCMGKGEDPPHLTAVLKDAYEHAAAVAFNRGVEVGRKANV